MPSPTASVFAAPPAPAVHRRIASLGLSFGLVLGPACTETPERESAPAKASDDPDASDPLVGYDLRRLRPREGESLAAMFDRMLAAAKAEDKRVVVLFSADWCEPCKILDLELGNRHPQSMIGDVRILEIKEDDWNAVARLNELNELRRRWEPVLNSYPLVIMLDGEGERVEDMKEAKQRLEDAGLQPTLPIWFAETGSAGARQG